MRWAGGLPLAIVLLAKQARIRPDLCCLWQEWDRRRTAMLQDHRYPHGTDGARLLNLEASIQLSLDRPLMARNPPALALLSLLSLLPNGASPQAVQAMIPMSSLSRENARPEDVLLQLSLAYAASTSAGRPLATDYLDDRLHVLSPIREYIRYKYPSREPDCQRLRKHYLDIAITYETTPQLSRLRHDITNLEAVTVSALNVESEVEPAVRCASVLCGFLEQTGNTLPVLTKACVTLFRDREQ